MEVLFSTDAVHPRDRFAFWHDVACRTIATHNGQPENRQQFTANLAAGRVHDIGLIAFETAAMTFERTHRQIRQTGSDDLFVCDQLAGTMELSQDGNELLLTSGSMTLLDPLMPCTGRISPKSHILIVKIPRSQLEARIGNARGFLLDKVDAANPDMCFILGFLKTLLKQADGLSDAAQRIVQQQLLDLIALSLLHSGPSAGLSSTRGIALLRLRSVIDDMLPTQDLCVDDVARAAGISVRSAHTLLATQGTSTKRLITERRLEKCRQALLDPAQTKRTISEIAYAWGFSDMSHFGRCFKDAYGMMPSQFRKNPRSSH